VAGEAAKGALSGKAEFRTGKFDELPWRHNPSTPVFLLKVLGVTGDDIANRTCGGAFVDAVVRFVCGNLEGESWINLSAVSANDGHEAPYSAGRELQPRPAQYFFIFCQERRGGEHQDLSINSQIQNGSRMAFLHRGGGHNYVGIENSPNHFAGCLLFLRFCRRTAATARSICGIVSLEVSLRLVPCRIARRAGGAGAIRRMYSRTSDPTETADTFAKLPARVRSSCGSPFLPNVRPVWPFPEAWRWSKPWLCAYPIV
jgi:hypothetical protein